MVTYCRRDHPWSCRHRDHPSLTIFIKSRRSTKHRIPHHRSLRVTGSSIYMTFLDRILWAHFSFLFWWQLAASWYSLRQHHKAPLRKMSQFWPFLFAVEKYQSCSCVLGQSFQVTQHICSANAHLPNTSAEVRTDVIRFPLCTICISFGLFYRKD